MPGPSPLPGFVAAGDGALSRLGLDDSVDRVTSGPVSLVSWGIDAVAGDPAVRILSRVVRTSDGTVPDAAVAAELAADPLALTRLLPPFAAVRGTADGVTMVADSMGLRQLHHSDPGSAEPVLATSSLVAARAVDAPWDETGVAVQSQLGWQLGQRTLRAGIQKLAPGAVATLDAQGVAVSNPAPTAQDPIDAHEAVVGAAELLRTSLRALLDDHPDAVLQLTGGQDSRILLSAIPPSRRRGVRAMTLGVAGSGDVAVASALAARDGLRHEVRGLGALDAIEPAEAWALSIDAAGRLDAMSDPIALAALTVAESAFEQGVRISGLGGEVARGFYYVGSVHDRAYTRRDAEQLAAWRMFVNETTETELFDPEFARWARAAADDAVFEAISAGGAEWFRATDELYLRHRMQRWAGVTDTAVAYQRVVVNPMLDEGFLAIAARLTPQDKAHSRFLASLQMELDPDLGRIPLEGRPAPIDYARPGAASSVRRTLTTARKAARKVAQRLRGSTRAPAGGEVLAAKVVAHWRQDPDVLAPLASVPFLDAAWIEQVLAGGRDPRPSSVAFLTNLVAASLPVVDRSR